MFRANLNRGGRSKTERNNGTINWSMTELPFCSIGLEGPQLSIGPPIVGVRKGSEENRRVGREGASSVFRGND